MGKENPWKRPVEERFWEKVDRSDMDGCWLWLAARTAGYGYFSYNGRPRFAHRVAWELEKGPIPPDLFLCHTCDVKTCVNPAHLFLGTQLDNMRDAWSKGRRTGREPGSFEKQGSGKPRSKLTPDQVQEIRERRAAGGLLRELGVEYGVSMSQVSRIGTRNRWQTLP